MKVVYESDMLIWNTEILDQKAQILIKLLLCY